MTDTVNRTVQPTAQPSAVNRPVYPNARTDGLTEMGVELRGNLSGRTAHVAETLLSRFEVGRFRTVERTWGPYLIRRPSLALFFALGHRNWFVGLRREATR